MQTANILLALGGDTGNTVPKFGVTPAEVAVLQLIHGSEAVFDIMPGEDVERTNREELQRLRFTYGKPEGSNEPSAVNVLFPGAAARVFESFDELDLDESFYKAERRVKPKPAPEPVEDADGEVEPKKPTAAQKKAAAKAAKEAEAAPANDAADGVEDMNDEVAEKGDGIFG
jgi:hypothetical protein